MKRKAALFIAESPREAWKGVIWPWFQEVVPNSWKQELPPVVVVPTRSHAHALKARLLQERQSYLGLQVVTPSGLRERLGKQIDRKLPLREHLRLLLAVAAEETLREATEGETSAAYLAAKAVVRAPDHLLRALDRLDSAGWDFGSLGLNSFQPVVRRFREKIRACGFSLRGEFDRQIAPAAGRERLFGNLLMAGFDAAHWPYWHLLQAAARGAESATIVLAEPTGDLNDFDLCWFGSWEEAFGEAQRFLTPAQPAGDALFSEAAMRGESQPEPRFDFLVGTNATEQAEAIAAQCVRYLADERCTRLGVIFSATGALPRLVSGALARLDIPHNDSLGHLVPGIFESAEWQAWIGLQRAPRLNSFLRFLNALPDPAVVSPELSRPALEKILCQSYAEVLLDDLDILREFCANGDAYLQSAAAVLRTFRFLPAHGTLPEFLTETQAALVQLGWKQHTFVTASMARDWSTRLNGSFSRSLFLRWLEEVAVSFGAERAIAGDHPYAGVQLLTVPQAQTQPWSHLIFAGWNEGAWPPPPSAEFARAEEICAFNRSVQQLNKRAARQGSQGEGHLSIRKDHSLYLGPIEQRAIAIRQFEALCEAATEAVTFAASLVQEDAPERLWNPSEAFTQRYRKERGQPLTQAALKDLQQATTRWLTDGSVSGPNKSLASGDVQQTLVAFNTRRDPANPAGEYDFALRPDGSYRPIPKLSVTDLERMVSAPALVWMKRYLGIQPPEDTSNPWAATSGKWVHGWLAAIGETKEGNIFGAFPRAGKIDECVSRSADERRAALERLCQALRKPTPDWWNSGWLNARYLARHLGGKIASAREWNWMAAEFPIGHESTVKVAGDVELLLRGQIDLILSRNEAADFAGQDLWIVDYKTGSTKELRSSDLHDNLVKGTILQLGLYSLALRELGAAEVEMSILSLAVKSVAPQLKVTALAEHTNVFVDLAEMQQTGVFGMKGELRPAFGYAPPYPLATLSIDNDTLEDKWALTHPNLVLEKEEWETW